MERVKKIEKKEGSHRKEERAGGREERQSPRLGPCHIQFPPQVTSPSAERTPSWEMSRYVLLGEG